MTARHSPAVHYPVRQAACVRWAWRLAALASLAVLLLWAWQGAGVGAAQWGRIGGAALVAVVCLGVSLHAVRHQPEGLLHWDGIGWVLELKEHSFVFAGSAQVLLDLQVLMLVRWVDEAHTTHRLVLQKNSAPVLWPDLRRAVYSSAYLPQSPSKLG